MLEFLIIVAAVAAIAALRLATFEWAARSGRFDDPIGGLYAQWFDDAPPLQSTLEAARQTLATQRPPVRT